MRGRTVPEEGATCREELPEGVVRRAPSCAGNTFLSNTTCLEI